MTTTYNPSDSMQSHPQPAQPVLEWSRTPIEAFSFLCRSRCQPKITFAIGKGATKKANALDRFTLLHQANEPLRIRGRTVAGVEEEAFVDHPSLKERGRSKRGKMAGPNMAQ